MSSDIEAAMSMSGQAAPPSKQDELVPHPVKVQLSNIAFCINSPPPWPEAILLGFQHYLVMLGTTVTIPTALVPQMGGGNEEKAKVIQTLLFVAGINTLLQTTFGTRLPAVIGGSYTFVAPTISIILARRYNDIVDPHEKFLRIMRGTQGALIVASTIQILLGFSGLWRKITRYLSPLGEAPLIALVGFGFYEKGFPRAAKCVQIGLPSIIVLVISQYIPHALRKMLFEKFAVIFSISFVWLYAHLLTVGGAYRDAPEKTQLHCRTDSSGLVGGAPWIRIPYPFEWGAPTFDAGEAFAMMAASYVAIVESTGTFKSVARYAGATPIPPSVLSRGIGWQGIGILLNGFFGTLNGSSVSVENAGLLGLTRVGSRRVVQISAGFMILFSILGKFGAVFASIPAPIFAGLYCVLHGYVGSAGISWLQLCNLNSFRTKFILGFSIFMGFSVPQYFNEYTAFAGHGPVHTRGRWFNDIVNVIFSSKPFVAGFVAYSLDNTLREHCSREHCSSREHCNREHCSREHCNRELCNREHCSREHCSSHEHCNREHCSSREHCNREHCSREHCSSREHCNREHCSREHCSRENCSSREHCNREHCSTARIDSGSSREHCSTAWIDSGYQYVFMFLSYKGDPRTHEFYRLPYNINKLFPSA